MPFFHTEAQCFFPQTKKSVKMKNNKRLLSVMLLAATFSGYTITASADNGKVVFSGNTGAGTVKYFGTKKKESYDVAVILADKSLKGKKIESIRAPFYSSDNIANVKVWISKKLTLKDKVNEPDVTSLNATFNGNTASASLAEPYTIDSDTLYVGYSFDVTNTDKYSEYPIAVSTEQNSAGFFLHTSRTYRKWQDKSSNGSSAIEVELSGIDANAVGLAEIDKVYGEVGKASDVTVTLYNHGYNAIKSVSYSYTAGDKTGSGQVELENPVPAIYNASTDIDVSIAAIDAKGKYPLKFTIDKVNGEANSDATTEEADYTVFTKFPKHNPVMEEYTGTWCGWCPRGFVALEVMNHRHSDFIGLSYHNSDAMEIMSSTYFPTRVSGFPSADMDRMYGQLDPYYGAGQEDFGIEKLWKANAKLLAPAAVDVDAEYADNGAKIAATAKLTFPEAHADADKYKVEFVLVADDLHGEGKLWDQSNNYTASNAGELPSPEADPFLAGQSTVSGLHFNDVVVATTRLTSGLATLPATIGDDETVEVKGEFETANVVNTSGNSLIQDASKMRVVAILINADGTIANAAKANVKGAESTGIATIGGKLDSVDTPAAIYDLQGQRVATMQRGVNIVKMADGRTSKIIIK